VSVFPILMVLLFQTLANEVLDGVHDEVAKPAADNLAANHSR